MQVVNIQAPGILAGSGGGDGAHTDDPQNPSSAMGRRFKFYEDDDDE